MSSFFSEEEYGERFSLHRGRNRDPVHSFSFPLHPLAAQDHSWLQDDPLIQRMSHLIIDKLYHKKA